MNSQLQTPGLERLVFDNRFTRELPADPHSHNQRRLVTGACFSRIPPRPVAAPRLIAFSRETAALLDLSEADCRGELFTEVFAGNRLLPGMDPYATCYGGHQFGVWAGQLGDGRAINLGEVVNARGERWILQLKGAGPTPYSRQADGFAVLRSSLREFLCSEAMHHLGVPTTRALSLVLSGEQVMRDMFYDGRPAPEPGAIVCRVAPTFTRFGHFEICTAHENMRLLRQLVDYTIRTDFPHLGEPNQKTYIAWFEEVCRRTLTMVVHWMRVGFVHGVMNTDNMSILGQTIDYGPYGWLEGYDPDWTPNTTDAVGRRYRFGQQPQVALWNLTQLANAILPVVGQVEPLQQAIANYAKEYEPAWLTMMASKLGLSHVDPARDKPLIIELLDVLQLVETDLTLFHRNLARLSTADEETHKASDAALLEPLLPAYYAPEALTGEHRARTTAWLRRYLERLGAESGADAETRRRRMNRVNPKYVLRNYLAQLAIDQCEQGDYALLHELLELLRHPYDEQPDKEQFAAKRPEWARQRAGCSMLSCSS
ncbi:MAG: YdiU family protein [Nitrococcus mobilis]|nr:YdiU family protein [Nitrococcus mobilis]